MIRIQDIPSLRREKMTKLVLEMVFFHNIMEYDMNHLTYVYPIEIIFFNKINTVLSKSRPGCRACSHSRKWIGKRPASKTKKEQFISEQGDSTYTGNRLIQNDFKVLPWIYLCTSLVNQMNQPLLIEVSIAYLLCGTIPGTVLL